MGNGGGWSMAAKFAGGWAAGTFASYSGTATNQQMIEQALASRGTGPGGWHQAAKSSFYNNGSAVSESDRYGTLSFQGQMSGFAAGTSGFNYQMGQIKGAAAMSPELTQMQVAQSQYSLGTAGGYTNLRRMGINPLNSKGHADPATVARQILQRMHSERVKTMANVNAAFGPAGSATVTLESYVNAGIIDANTAEVVKQQMFDQLTAQVHGMDYKEYHTAAMQAGGTSNAASAARDKLANAGIDTDTRVGSARENAGNKIDKNSETIGGWNESMRESTDLMGKFNDVLRTILKIPGAGEAVGYGSSAWANFGSSVMSFFGGGAGGAAPRMSTASWDGGGSAGGGGGFAMAGAGFSIGGGVGGSAPRPSGGGGGGGGGGSNASAGTRFIAPRPGINAMSSEQDFGPRTIGQGFHTGVDLQGGVGAPIKAAAAGTVVGAGWGASGDAGYGNTVMINHGGGYTSMYAHMSHITVSRGAQVRQGQIIGGVGDTGSYSQGAHLHFEIHVNGKPVDPKPYIGGGRIAHIGNPSAPGGSGSAGATGSASSGSGTGAAMGTTGSFAIGNAYSEVAALALGSAGAGLTGGSSAGSSGTPGGGTVGTGMGASGSGGPGSLSIGAYNFKHGKAPMSDVDKILGRVGVFGTSETRTNHGKLADYLGTKGWGYQQGNRSDTGLAYDQSKYRMLKHDSMNIEGTLWGGKKMHNAVPYMLLQDKETGAKFWVMSAHTQVHGYKGGPQGDVMRKQYAQINSLFTRLSKSGDPVYLVGDLNNPHPLASGIAPKGAKAYGSGLDYIIASGGKYAGGGSLAGTGFHGKNNPNAVMHSDHPFNWGNFNIGSAGVPGGGGSNEAIVRAAMKQFGWGGQWSALKQLVSHESGFNPRAQNPTSSAYGMFQFLNSTWAGVGGHKTSDPRLQALYGMKYIKQRYGSPNSAWDFWQKHNWYDVGEWNIRDDKDARVHKGEMVIPSKIADVVRDELTSPGIRDALGGKGRGKVEVNFHSGAIRVEFPGGATSKRDAERAAGWVVDAMMEDKRMKQLAEG
jgi:murein DD-endopeptidase MepM/ murein hydrolase activator NlpD